MRHVPGIWQDFDRSFSNFGAEFERPLETFRPLLRQLEEFMRDMPSVEGLEALRTVEPFCDVKEHADHYVLSFDMPGLEKDNINVEVEGNRLIISGERKQEKEEKGGRTRLLERQFRRYERTLTLPTDVKAEGVEASYQNGVLAVALPKSPAVKKHRVSIGEGKMGLLGKIAEESSKKEKVPLEGKNNESAGAKF